MNVLNKVMVNCEQKKNVSLGMNALNDLSHISPQMTNFLFQVLKIIWFIENKKLFETGMLEPDKIQAFTVVKKIVSRMERSIFDEF